MDEDFLNERITRTKQLIVAYEDVLLKIAANPARSYTINTGQTTETVTRHDAESLQRLLRVLYNQLNNFTQMADYDGPTIVVPSDY
jgi:hypothetical protein